ncbi:roadblock/LC7 domain-containing protein [Actinomadura algeriensis]|uniref:Regulator of Ras-like GTPase activity (Roadblock/LC7/MglB family) n=1 Tax=Actinomadura algeriensis TaxID=1679523 RepID=A0ABR9JIS4_9ACTN|nr:roadblock/LC7 domain-containing protein [Actinomadura algeriensis]MBE1530437.1 putative regulator of Ras-like GTPase activity (Roadblock/LC7/MglB family) [Actinomadura algeriensis]
MTAAPITAGEVRGLLDALARRAAPLGGVVRLSNDGLVVASSTGLGREESEHLAALVSGVQGLARGACRRFAGGELLQSVIELDTALVFMVPAGEGASLVATGPPDVDAGTVVYELTELAERFAERPPVLPRLSVPGPR